MFCLLETDEYPASVSLGYQNVVYGVGNHQFQTRGNYQSHTLLMLSGDEFTVCSRMLIPLPVQIWSNHATTPFGTKHMDFIPGKPGCCAGVWFLSPRGAVQLVEYLALEGSQGPMLRYRHTRSKLV